MQCRTHPTAMAFNTCNQCGDWLCDDCTVDVQGRLFCRKCLMELAAPPKAPTTTHHAHGAAGHTGRHVSWGLLFLFSFFFPSGVNYMYMGLIKRGLAALCGFFLIVYFISLLNWPLTLLFSLALPVYILTCIFDGFNVRRRINAGEVVEDNIDGAINFLRRNKYIGWIVFALVAVGVVTSILRIFVRFVAWALPIVIIVFGLYLLLRNNKPTAGGE